MVNTQTFLLLALLLTPISVLAQEVEKTQKLEEVIVTSKIPYIKLKGGAIAFNPQSIIQKRAINNALDLLRYAPGVSITDGSVKLLGVYHTTILLNGTNTGASTEQLLQYLQTLDPKTISSIELMPIAPSHTGIKGAAINISINPSKDAQGLSASITATGEIGKYHAEAISLGLSSIGPKWNSNLSIALNNTKSGSETQVYNKHTLATATNTIPIEQNTLTEIAQKQYSVQLNTGYRIDDKNELNLLAYITGQKRGSHNTGEVLIDNTQPAYHTGVSTDSDEKFYHLDAGYKNPNIVNANLSYSGYSGDRNAITKSSTSLLGPNSLSMYNGYTIQRYRSLGYNLHRTSLLGSSLSLTYGILGSYHTTESDNTTKEQVLGNESRYLIENKEYEHSVHALLSYAASPKLNISLGGAINLFHRNQTLLSSKISETNLLPKLQIVYTKNKDNIYALAVDAQRYYPSYDELSSIQLSRNGYSTYMGNPFLRPALSYTGNLQYIFRQRHSLSLWGRYTHGEKIVMPYQRPDKLNSIISPINLDYQKQIGLTLSTNTDIASLPGLSVSGNISGIYLHQRLNNFHNLSIDKKRFFIVGNLRTEYKVPGHKDFRIGIDAMANTESIQGIYRIKGMWRIDPWINYTFWGGRATLSISFIDLFNTYRPHTLIEEIGQYEEMKQWNFLRRLKVEFIYRIGRKNKDNKLPAPDIERYMQVKSNK